MKAWTRAFAAGAVAFAVLSRLRSWWRRRLGRRDLLLSYAADRLRDAAPPTHPMPTPRLELPFELPAAGIGGVASLEQLAPMALDGAAQLGHPGYFAHMDPLSADIACAASLWQTATNQNLLHPDAAPTARLLEERVISWLAPFFGMRGGHLVPGSTVANLTALWAARDVAKVSRVLASDRAHNSVRKAASLLGLEFVEVRSDPDTHECDGWRGARGADLSDAAVVLTAGTVATGAIDPLVRPVSAAWVHVDAAWAGPMAISPALAAAFDGVGCADSVGFSAHKWLYQPKGCAAVLFRDVGAAHGCMSYGGGYLATPTVGVVGSAPASALPLAATLLAWGRDGVAARLEADVAKARELAELVRSDPRFELWGEKGREDRGGARRDGPSPRDSRRAGATGVVAWRPRADLRVPVEALRKRMVGAWVSLTVIDGETWLRSVAANPAAEPRRVFASVVAAMEALASDN